MEKTAEKLANLMAGVVNAEDAGELIEFAKTQLVKGSEALKEFKVETIEELTEENLEKFCRKVAEEFAGSKKKR